MGAIIRSEALCEKALDALKMVEQLPFSGLERAIWISRYGVRNGMSPIHMGHPLPHGEDIRGWRPYPEDP